MKYDMDKGYWSNKPMAEQLEAYSTSYVAVYYGNYDGLLDLRDFEGLVKIGVRFPELERMFKNA